MKKTSLYARKRRGQVQRIKVYDLWSELNADSVSPMSEEKRGHHLSVIWKGYKAIQSGKEPTKDDWRVCSDAVNILESLIEMGVCQDASGLLQDAVTALALAGKRSLQGHNIRLDAKGLEAVRAVLVDYEEILSSVPERTMIRAHRLTEQRVHQILDGKRQPHDLEVVDL